MNESHKNTWLLLIHQIPPKPDYFRVKIWRRLQKIGAVAVKQSVYVLPDTEQAFEDLHWIVKEIEGGGGTASLSRSVFLKGVSNKQVENLFNAARDEDYKLILQEGKEFISKVSTRPSDNYQSPPAKDQKEFLRLQRRFDEVAAIDFFQAVERSTAEKVVLQCKELLASYNDTAVSFHGFSGDVKGKVWVTRKGLFIDRIGCIWLIRRFIDNGAQFKYIADEKYSPLPDEIRFDMFEAEFTHQGDKCTFEVLVETFNLTSSSLTTLAQIIHDIDLKEEKFKRPETAGIKAVFSGLKSITQDDTQRLQRGLQLLDELYVSFNGSVQE